ncbi:MAG: rRNA (cytosine1402-N4)-methyltransferase [Acidimicrobiaceae bacterium]|nr:rRNA (cytosine1402-N4)-methyltransferase [Acidimicrobiaceae bacterium]
MGVPVPIPTVRIPILDGPGPARPMCSPSTGEMEVPFSARFPLGRSGRNPDGRLVEGLQMNRPDDDDDADDRIAAPDLPDSAPGGDRGTPDTAVLLVSGVPDADATATHHPAPPGTTDAGDPDGRPFPHLPVMVDEVVAALAPVPPGVVLDATVGGGGHAAAILAAHPHLRLIGLDQDPDAVAAARRALAPFGDRAEVHRARFDELDRVLDAEGIGRLSGALFDLGVSSPQLDRPERGFTFRVDAPLDMRMDPDRPTTAADLVNTMREQELVRLLVDNGEGRFARRVARAIMAARPLTTTAELAEVVRNAIPAAARRTGGHPARRVFQGLRIEVNEELDVLPVALDAALERLGAGGRCVVLAYHSGEDRLVKRRFQLAVDGGCTCPPGLPCQCGATPTMRLVTRGARKASPEELAANPRSGSARLRVAERLPFDPPDTPDTPDGSDGSDGSKEAGQP